MAKGQVVDMVVEEVAENLEEAAAVARKIDTRLLAVALAGVGVGLAVGFIAGRRWQKQNAEDAAWRKAEKEIAEIREMYQRSSDAIKIVPSAPKPPLNEIVEERGYSQRVTEEEAPRPTKPPVPVTPASHFVAPDTPKRKADTEKDKYDGWHWEQEIADRKNSPDKPYIIHQDEFFNRESEYVQVTYTFYQADEIVADEHEEKIEDSNTLLGAANLEAFGHGTDDWDVLYIRNDNTRLDYEVCRVNKSYEEEVLGITHDISSDEMDDGAD